MLMLPFSIPGSNQESGHFSLLWAACLGKCIQPQSWWWYPTAGDGRAGWEMSQRSELGWNHSAETTGAAKGSQALAGGWVESGQRWGGWASPKLCSRSSDPCSVSAGERVVLKAQGLLWFPAAGGKPRLCWAVQSDQLRAACSLGWEEWDETWGGRKGSTKLPPAKTHSAFSLSANAPLLVIWLCAVSNPLSKHSFSLGQQSQLRPKQVTRVCCGFQAMSDLLLNYTTSLM